MILRVRTERAGSWSQCWATVGRFLGTMRVEVALEQSTAGEALTLALDDRAARLQLPLGRWTE